LTWQDKTSILWLKSTILKIAAVLLQYLHTHKRLDLPGIGTFTLDANTGPDPDYKTKDIQPDAIAFESNVATGHNEDLIKYISSETGKMKALAAADLDSYLQSAQQFLNIGKPFLIEGIGNLVRVRSGEFSFSPGDNASEKIKEYSIRNTLDANSPEKSFNYNDVFNPPKEKISWRKPVMALLLLAGLALTVLGGYALYKKTLKKNNAELQPENNNGTVIVPDTSNRIQNTATPVINPGVYKFVLEVADSQRAYFRYNQLKSYQWKVELEKKDPASYHLFLKLPAAVTDTARIADSLKILIGRKVFVEQ
jgi:nucleoid DNA-binding protein